MALKYPQIRTCAWNKGGGTCDNTFEVEDPGSGRKYCSRHANGLEHPEAGTDPITPRPVGAQAPDFQTEFDRLAQLHLKTHLPLPPIPDRINANRVEDMGFDTEQEMVLLFSDYHYGSKIDKRVSAGLAEYNPDIARGVRLPRYRDGALRFTQQDQHLITIKRLHILADGDELEGHGKMFGTQGLQMDMAMGFQVVDFVDDMSNILMDFLRRYEMVDVYKVPGNHGRTATSWKDAYPPDNAELFAWQMIAERLTSSYNSNRRWTDDLGVRHYEGGPFRFHITPAFIMFPEICGFLFALRHGHGIKGIQATYTGALDNMLRMNGILGENIQYYIKAHLHEAQSSESVIQGELIQNGCFVGPSLLSVEMSRAAANLPSQEMLLMHPRRGITNRHRITLAEVSEVRQFQRVRF